MNKRISTLTLFVVGTLLLGLVGAIAALAAPSADPITGTISYENGFYTSPTTGSAVKITINDADVNKNEATSTSVTLTSTIGGTELETLPLGGFDAIVGIPEILLSGACADDPRTLDTNLLLSVFNATTGVVQIQAGTSSAGSPRTVCYDVGKADTLTVKVWSSLTGAPGADEASRGVLTLTATETEVSSGVFEVEFDLIDTTTSTTALFAQHLNTITADYTDTTPTAGASEKITANATVETDEPVSSNLVPVTDFATQNDEPTFNGTISDSGGAGIDIDTILVGVDVNADGNIDSPTEEFAPDVTGSDGDIQVTFSLTAGTYGTLTEGDVEWFVKANDLAGNVGKSDSDADLTGDQENLIRIDLSPPDITNAITGNYWDSVTDAVKFNRNTSIEVQFNDPINGASVSPGDFTVDGLTPVAADVFSDLNTSVFLTAGSPIAADATPVVAIATGGAVSDTAGNALNVGEETAVDGIAPVFTVTLDATLTGDELIISIASDENIAGVPTVEIWKAGDTAAEKTIIPSVITTESWTAKFTTIGGSDGEKSVVVKGNDLAIPGNSGEAGDEDPDADGAITFTQDTTAPSLTFDPDGTADVTTAAPFVKANYVDASDVTVTKAEFGEKGSTLTDVTSLVFSSDDKQWIYAASGLEVGKEYTFKVTAEDAAANELADQSVTFEVAARPEVDIPLVPGNNLISLPGTPANANINSVGLPANVTSVITYDPTPAGIAAGGPWLVATRDTSGNLVGTLSSIDSLHAYWVESTSSAPIEVDIPAQSFAAVPPSILVVNGWNLVPVVSVAGDDPGDTISADLYFGSTAWITAYWFNTAGNAWIKVLPNQIPAHTVTVGNGYWLYAGQDGVLVP